MERSIEISARVLTIHRIVPAVGEHIIAEHSLSGRCEGIGVYESANFRVIISSLAIIQPGFVGLHIAGRGGFGVRMAVFKYAEKAVLLTPGAGIPG